MTKKKEVPRTDVIITDIKPTKLAIVGFAPNWEQAPFDDENFEIWGLNELYKYFMKHDGANADRWFEIHSRFSPTKNVKEHTEWLKKCPIPIYMWEHYPDIPCSVPYPKEEILKFTESKGLTLDTVTDGVVSTTQNRYATNSITWMLLLGWMEGFKEIHIYGVDLACKEEYLYQRPNLEYYIGAAQADGVKVVMPPTCDLLKATQLYGFESDNKFRLKMKARIVELEERKKLVIVEMNKCTGEVHRLTNMVNDFKGQIIAIEGCMKEDAYWLKNWVV